MNGSEMRNAGSQGWDAGNVGQGTPKKYGMASPVDVGRTPRGATGPIWTFLSLHPAVFALLSLVTWATACSHGRTGREDRRVFTMVRFIEVTGQGNIAVVSDAQDGRILVSRSGLATWWKSDIWLLGRKRLFALIDGAPNLGEDVCSDAARILHVGSYILVSCPRQGKVEVYDGGTLARIETLDVCDGVSEMAAVPSGRTVFLRCRDGLAVLAGRVAASPGKSRSIVLLSQAQGVTALSEDGFFLWFYPDVPQVDDWAVTEPKGRTIIGVGRRIRVTGDLAVQGDSEYSVALELAQLSFGADLTEVTAVKGGFNVRELARSKLGNPFWDFNANRLLVPLPGAGKILSVSSACLGQTDQSPQVHSACGMVSSLPGRPGAVLPSPPIAGTSRPLAWDRAAQTLWRIDDSGSEVFRVFDSADH